MTVQEISQLVGSIGIPGVILLYLVWRLDKFLTKLCETFHTINSELGFIADTLKELVGLMKK